MKNLPRLLFFILLVFAAKSSFSSSYNDFTYDKNELESEFADLTQLENYVSEHKDLTLSNMLSNSSILPNSLLQNLQAHPRITFDDPPSTAFFLGCCLGPIGVLIILASSDAGAGDVGKAITGCIVPSALFSLGIYFNDPFFIQLAIEIFIEVWSSQ